MLRVFFPSGNRDVCRFVKAARFGSAEKEDYFKDANTKFLILQVEGKEGIENLDGKLKIEGYDILFIGPYDLSQSLGIPGQIDHPKMEKLMNDVAVKVNKREKDLAPLLILFPQQKN